MTPASTDSSRKLPRGGSALDPAAARQIQRERLIEGMVEVAARHGYAASRVADVAAAAHVSRNTFYELFADREECFLAAWEATLSRANAGYARLAASADELRSPQERLQHLLRGLSAAVIARPDHARLLIVEALAIGGDGPAYRRRLTRQLEQWVGEAIERAEGGSTIAASARTVVASGTLQVVDQRLRSGRVRQLRSVVDDLASWAVSYETTSPLPAHRALGTPQATPSPPRQLPLPRGHQKLPRSFVDRYQHERILQAVTLLAVHDGYAGVTVPEIVSSARISNKTFYDHFASKDEAFLAAYDEAFADLFAASWAAAGEQRDWVDAVRAGVKAWVDYLVADPLKARFGFYDVLTSGGEAAARVDESYKAFAHLLSYGFDHLPPERSVPPIAPYAIAAGIAGLVSDWVVAGRVHELHELAPDLCYVALAPFLGDTEARNTAETLQAA
jgi:AcrR family transcriptional regulator